jgi:DNA-binding transcriptional LysR family regulator
MRHENWNDLRFLLAVKRAGTLSGAARQLLVDDTTVSRRLSALQSAFGARLVRRLERNRLVLTELGEHVVRKVEAMDREYRTIPGKHRSARSVRFTSVPILVNRMFARALRNRAPLRGDFGIELIPDNRNLDLANGEADLAVRLARPRRGGMRLKARLLGRLAYAAYAAAEVPDGEGRQLPWIGYHETMSHLPQARWMAEAARTETGMSRVRVWDADTALETVAAGSGKTLLPVVVADSDPRLRRVGSRDERTYPSREIWLVAATDQRDLPAVSAAADWVTDVVNPAPASTPPPSRGRRG